MIAKLIEWSVRNRWMVIVLWIGIALWSLQSVWQAPVDAIPDLSENQVIVFTDWMGRSPQDIEDQITFPLSVQLQGLAGVKDVRSSSEFNFSMISVIFDEKTDYYFARQRVLERLQTASTSLPQGVTAYMAPDATALGQIYWYTVESDTLSLDELRALQDWTIRYQLNSVPGVSEVASVGGFVRQYQVEVDPARLRAYNIPLSKINDAIMAGNKSVGGKVIDSGNSEYLIRGVGWIKNLADIENIVIENRDGVPIRVKELATVSLGPEFRRSALEKEGKETVGGVVLMRYGENPLEVTRKVVEKIRQIQPGLPEGVRIVPFYDRTRLIHSAIHTVTRTLTEEIIIASVAILLLLTHVRSAIAVCITLPLAVGVSFIFMRFTGVSSNIMSLAGIAISIGILVDAAVVMVENATHELHDRFGKNKVTGDTTELVISACRLVGRPIFFSVLIMLVSFLPIFAFTGQEGKLTHPLAYTKSFAMIGVAILAVTLVPAIIPLLIRGRLRGEEENPIVRSFINVYKPTLTWLIVRPGVVWTIFFVILGLGVGFMMRMGSEFMPPLNEGSLLDMPTAAPRVSMSQAVADVKVRDEIIRSFPEIEAAVGKVGRAQTATDPSGIDMVETIITLRPNNLWPRRHYRFEDAMEQAKVVADELVKTNLITPPSDADLNSAASFAVEKFDQQTRKFFRDAQIDDQQPLAHELSQLVAKEILLHAQSKNALIGKLELPDLPVAAEAMHLAALPLASDLDGLIAKHRQELSKLKFINNPDDLLTDAENPFKQSWNFLKESLGSETPDFSQRLLAKIEKEREIHIIQQTQLAENKLFNLAPDWINDNLIRTFLNVANKTLSEEQIRDRVVLLRPALDKKLYLWKKSQTDLQRELDSELQMPGWGNAWTQPIINRVNMLATGVRTQIGVKIFGPTGKPLEGENGAIADIQRVSDQIASKLKGIRGAVDVVADQSTGKRYLEITLDREKAGRYGVNMDELAFAVETAIGGDPVTRTIEGRQRFPVALRFPRDDWRDEESIGNILISAKTAEGGMETPIPLKMVADIRFVEGPNAIKSENGRLRAYVTLNVRDRDIVGFVNEAKESIKPITASLSGTGMSIEFAGEFEHQLRARKTLAIIFPVVILTILFLLFVTFKDLTDTLLVFLAVLGALCGSLIFQFIFKFHFSVIVSVGYVAAFGMATQTGVIMLVYLRQAIEKHGGLSNMTAEKLKAAVIEGAVHRLRPKLLTEGVAIIGLVPMLWATGTGAEIMRPMAAPVLGGLLIADEVVDILIPVLFYWVRKRRIQA